MIRMIAHVQRDFSINLGIELFQNGPTISGMAEVIEKQSQRK